MTKLDNNLIKQANYKKVFFNFAPVKISTLTEGYVERLMQILE
jgi:3-methyladenine DNA glycosylase Tag